MKLFKSLTVALLASSPINAISESIVVESSGGRYYLETSSEPVNSETTNGKYQDYYNQSYKAFASATNYSLECGCDVFVKIPDVKVRVNIEPSETAPTTYKMLIQWVAPTSRKDGSHLAGSEILKYIVSYGLVSEELNLVEFTEGSETSHTVKGVTIGNWVVKLATVDVLNIRSDWSKPFFVDIKKI